jgi:excisionase family DNA binding protein
MAVSYLEALELVHGSAAELPLRKPMGNAGGISAVTTPKRDDGLLSLDEAAQHLNITPDQVKGFAQDGELRYINVGRGKKRPRIRFTIEDLNEFIERRKRRDVAACQSIGRRSQPRITGSISKSEVIGFTALRAAQIARKPRK